MTRPLILVAGATRERGSAVVEQPLERGFSVRALDHDLRRVARTETELDRAASGSYGVGVGVINTHHVGFSKSQRPNSHGNGIRASREVHRA